MGRQHAAGRSKRQSSRLGSRQRGNFHSSFTDRGFLRSARVRGDSSPCRGGCEASLFSGRSVLFYSDLAARVVPPAELPSFLAVERKQSSAELDPIDLEAMTGFWNSKLAQRNVKERFEKGASLWLIKSEGRLAGYGWTLRGRTIQPHYFPIGQDDAHLFDFHVFPQHRRRGMNPFLVDHILRGLATEGVARALIEAAERNHPQLSSPEEDSISHAGLCTQANLFWSNSRVLPQKYGVPIDSLTSVSKISGLETHAHQIPSSVQAREGNQCFGYLCNSSQ